MKKYIVTKREVWVQQVEVDAESEQEAIIAVSHGKGEECDDTLEYSHDIAVEFWTTD